MEDQMQIKPVGRVRVSDGHFSVQLEEEFIPALKHIEGYSHLQIIWWAHLTDDPESRGELTLKKIFKKGPEDIGVFATRSPVRPNPIMISTVNVLKIDTEKGIIAVSFIDAVDESIVLDIKPYRLMERIRECSVPEWCRHWPEWHEEASGFDWKQEINF
ncbi:MAG TPA: S-adenosylmethionine-dependent methyltransferase [Bacteroides sp.]|nr:S-adenosylmethionine-dependent methyltransferase [Bacteroides sp.]